ncbi:hypothetical protein [Pyruvatibacter sp.]|uniref:hypothetical protein n=1 Tax=Pyruvatibacter sp. TaxID=1981328 RepID=UPI003262D450
MIRLLTIAGLGLFLTAPAPTSAHALMVSAETALVCPQLEDFQTVASGTDVPGCVRVEKHMDLYGPVGRAPKAPGGPFVRVRVDERLYWAEEHAFYMPSQSAAPGDAGLSGDKVPLPPAN